MNNKFKSIAELIFDSNTFKIKNITNNELIIYNTNSRSKKVVQLKLEKNNKNSTITVYSINKYQSFTGSYLLNKVKELSDRLKIKIYLDDSSVIKLKNYELRKYCYYSLRTFHILSDGESWYNKYGFVSRDYELEKIHNYELITMTLIDFINSSLVLRKNKLEKSVTERYPSYWNSNLKLYRTDRRRYGKDLLELESKISKCKEYESYGDYLDYENEEILRRLLILPEILIENDFNGESIVKDIMQFLKMHINQNIIKLNCNDPLIRWLIEFVTISDYSIIYDNDLFYTPI